MTEQSLDRKYILLEPAPEPLLPRPLTEIYTNPALVATLLNQLPEGSDIFLDCETTGLDPTDPEQGVVGVGIANDVGTYYIDTRTWDDRCWDLFFRSLLRHRTYAFNAPFDHSWLYRYSNYNHINLAGDTLCLFRLLANEGWPGQSHSLETLQDDILRWPSSQKTTLEELLLRHGITKGNGSSPDKSRMYLLSELEPEIFAEYCALDAEAARLGWYELTRQATALGASGTLQYATEEWPNEIELIIEGEHSGIRIAREMAERVHRYLEREEAKAEGHIRKHPRLAGHIREREREKLGKKAYVSVSSRRTKATASDNPLPSEGWLFEPSTAKSLTASQKAEGGYWYRNTYTYSIAGWDTGANSAPPRFNPGSWHDMGYLLYECLYSWEESRDGAGRPTAIIDVDGRTVEVLLTSSGSPPTGAEILPALGEIGALFTRYNEITKKDEYVRAYLTASDRDGRLHPKFKAPGTITGRLSGGS